MTTMVQNSNLSKWRRPSIMGRCKHWNVVNNYRSHHMLITYKNTKIMTKYLFVTYLIGYFFELVANND